jgi:hypothetical protein
MVEAGLVDSRECETTLANVITELCLVPLSASDEQMIRNELAAIIGYGLKASEESPKLNPDGKLTVRDLQTTLTKIADGLDVIASTARLDANELSAIDRVMRGTETGFHESHDIQVALKIRSTLAAEIGLTKAQDRMADFHKWPRTIAEACRRAAVDLDLIRGTPGRQSRDWYRDFKRVLVSIARKNGIKPKVIINRRTHEAQGRFIDLAEKFERLLPRDMRSPSREAIAKRLERSKI